MSKKKVKKMDILDLLTNDHERLSKELVNLRHNLLESNLRERIKGFITDFELHESIEEEILFPGLDDLENNVKENSTVKKTHEAHEDLWELFADLVDSLSISHFNVIQKKFFNLTACIEGHFEYEERILFPVLRERVDQKKLNQLGEKAGKRFDHFLAENSLT